MANIKRINPSIQVLPLALDISQESSIAAAFKTTSSHFPGGVDVLVSNAVCRTASDQPIASCDVDQWWDQDLTTNIRGSMLLTKYFFNQPTMATISGADQQTKTPVKRKIVYISSGVAYIVQPGQSSYSFSKLVLNQLAAYAHAESTEDVQVQAVAVHPGIFVTDLLEDIYRFYAADTNELAGGVVNWATSDEASFLSGRYTTANVCFNVLPLSIPKFVEEI